MSLSKRFWVAAVFICGLLLAGFLFALFEASHKGNGLEELVDDNDVVEQLEATSGPDDPNESLDDTAAEPLRPLRDEVTEAQVVQPGGVSDREIFYHAFATNPSAADLDRVLAANQNLNQNERSLRLRGCHRLLALVDAAGLQRIDALARDELSAALQTEAGADDPVVIHAAELLAETRSPEALVSLTEALRGNTGGTAARLVLAEAVASFRQPEARELLVQVQDQLELKALLEAGYEGDVARSAARRMAALVRTLSP